MQIHSVGIDLGKTTFHLVALGAAGKVQEVHPEAAVGLYREHADLQSKIEYICADLSSRPNYSLAVARRTIHYR